MANQAIDFLKSIDKALDDLDMKALEEAQSNHDAMTAKKIKNCTKISIQIFIEKIKFF